MLCVTMLGCGGTQPLPDRALASLAVTAGGHSILFDCGEGTQVAARRRGVSVFKLDAVLLTHYHGDHIFGLPGLWQTMAAQGRTVGLLCRPEREPFYQKMGFVRQGLLHCGRP